MPLPTTAQRQPTCRNRLAPRLSCPSSAADNTVSDEELADRFEHGDGEAVEVLIQRYRGLARSKTSAYFLVGADANDVEQEGLIGLFKAARDFQPDRQVNFKMFADLCITRQIVTAVKTANRRKHQALNQYASVTPRGAEEDYKAEKLFGPDPNPDPSEYAASQEQLNETRRHMADMLTSLEVDVLRLHVEGYTYKEISDRLGRHVKSIDNCLQRVKRKAHSSLRTRAVPEMAVGT